MTQDDVQRVAAEIAAKYLPLITLEEAAEISRCHMGTIYDRAHRGKFDRFKSRRGKGVLLVRDEFVRFLMTDPPEA